MQNNFNFYSEPARLQLAMLTNQELLPPPTLNHAGLCSGGVTVT